MNKQEASSLLKNLLAECNLDSNSFVLVEPNPKDKLAIGYTIRVKAMLDSDCRLQLRHLTKKYNLAVIEEKTEIIIYKPPADRAGKLILK
jgi:hypothetical protein